MSCTKRLFEIKTLSKCRVLYNYYKPTQSIDRNLDKTHSRIYKYTDYYKAIEDIHNISTGYCFRCGHVTNCLKNPPPKYKLNGILLKKVCKIQVDS